MENKSTDLFIKKSLIKKKYDRFSNNNNFSNVVSKSLEIFMLLCISKTMYFIIFIDITNI
jgi:hypothetical protein